MSKASGHNSDFGVKRSRSYLVWLLSRREYTVKQLRDKLLRKTSAEITDAAIAEIQAMGLQDDRRWAEAALRGCLRKGQGPKRIEAKFFQAGVTRELTDELLSQIEETELIATHYAEWDLTDPKQCQRLLRRGFSYSAICSLKTK